MILLAVDTSHAKGSMVLAELKDNQIIRQSERRWQKQAMHSEVATLELQSLLHEFGIDLQGISHLSVNVGPGSFTGLRVGINLVRTLSYVFSLPVFTFSTLELLAPQNQRAYVAIKAIQNFFYVAAYADGEPLFAPTSLEHPQIAAHAREWNCTNVLVEGDTPGFESSTQALDQVQFINKNDLKRPFFAWSDVVPLYIRGSEAEEKLRKGLLKSL